MTKTLLKVSGFALITLFCLSGCGDNKTTVTKIQNQQADNNIGAVQPMKIKTH